MDLVGGYDALSERKYGGKDFVLVVLPLVYG